MSNGNISLMVDLARHNNFPWDAILGAEVAGDYKPKPRVYLAACAAFDLEPAQCMMVAAHSSDLAAAALCGLRTGHTARVNEYGPGTGEAGPKVKVDLAAQIWPISPASSGLESSPPIHRRRLREEAFQNVIDDHVVLLLEAGVRNAGHHGELLVRVGQLGKELRQVIE